MLTNRASPNNMFKGSENLRWTTKWEETKRNGCGRDQWKWMYINIKSKASEDQSDTQ